MVGSKRFLFKVLFCLFTFAFCILAVEILLRFLPVNEGTHRLAVNKDQPIPRMEPDRAFTWSKGARFQIVTRKRSNNEGFICDDDYVPAGDGVAKIAVVGDSFVEACHVDYAESISGLLASHLRPHGLVYSLGVGGSQLATYLNGFARRSHT